MTKEQEQVKNRGTVKWFDDEKGYGFITGPDGKDIFVHYSSIEGSGFKKLERGDVVDYFVGNSEKDGKRMAICVNKVRE